MSRDTYPECEQQHCTQSLHPFALCSSKCTRSRSPNRQKVSWPQVPSPSWMSKSNRAANLFDISRVVKVNNQLGWQN